ncbi:MAG: putative peptide maturation dehydrogenase [Actinomycetota bacterium]|nr:putative peptide maturation dehydrogenase [Actinomycetota bacterium]
MARIRRTPYAFFYLEDNYRLDLASLIRAELPSPAPEARIVALAILTGKRHELQRRELELLLSVPADRWIAENEGDPEATRALVEKGLLLSDSNEDGRAALRDRDEALSANAWNLYASLYHYMTQWSGLDTEEGLESDDLRAERFADARKVFVARYGPPPDAFAKIRPGRTLALPGRDRAEPLYRILTARRTTWAFDPDVPMTLTQLDAVIRYVFGCHGYAFETEDYAWIKRTSPSGGGLHPIEVYPIITNVTGVSPGIYQYGSREHTLTLLSELDAAEARRTATSFMCGQRYFGEAHVSFILTARFYRNHWKYRCHEKAYTAILMDAAHLSQTLYLVSAERGLGAFVTIAVNGSDVERHLGFDGIAEGVIAIAGCGIRAADRSPSEQEFSPRPPV